jgi:hypothetical protein
MSALQLELNGDTKAQAFEVWKALPGGRQLLNWIYRDAAAFAARWQRTGQRVSMDYLFHRQRDRLRAIHLRLAKSGCAMPKVGGYRLNDHFTAYIARHIVSRRPEWAGMFELREMNKPKRTVRTTVVREEVLAA